MTATVDAARRGRWPTADQLFHLQAISRDEASKRLGICVKTLDRMVKAGELHAVRYASRVMIPITELERLLTPMDTPRLSSTDAWAADHPRD